MFLEARRANATTIYRKTYSSSFVSAEGQNDHSGTDNLHGIRIRNCGRNAGSLKALQSGYGLHEIQPEDLGAYQDLLLRLRRIGRSHHGTNI
jgi:hypothetical protein